MADMSSYTRSPRSGTRQRVRVRADLGVVIAFPDGHKAPARVIDVSTGGMNVRCDRAPAFGERLTVIVRLQESGDWHLIPATVRWLGGQGFGLGFENLDARQTVAFERFVAESAA